MFRMKFQPTADYSSSGDEEDERTVRVDSLVGCSPEPTPKAVIFEGRVGKFGKIRPLPASDKKPPHFADGLSSLRSMILSPTAQVVPISSPKPKLAVVDLVNLEEPAQDSTDSLPREATVVLNAKSLPVNDCTTDKTTVVACLHYQDSAEGQDSKVVLMEAVVEPPCALLESRTDSSRSESSECSTSTCRSEEEDEAMREVINKLMEERKNILLKSDHKFSKPSEEPLLAAHDQEELELMAKEEARVEAKRLAEEERLERERQLREIRALAHCDTVSARSLGRSPTFKKSKLKGILSKTGVTGVYSFLKRPFRIFRSHKKHTEYPNAREAKVIAPKPSLFGGCRTVPSSGTTDAQLAMMRNAPRPGLTRLPHIKFAMVESTQRDVPAWTREEYLRKNGRIPHHSTSKNDDEEFGGIEGNNLMNQYFDDGILTDYDSDSD